MTNHSMSLRGDAVDIGRDRRREVGKERDKPDPALCLRTEQRVEHSEHVDMLESRCPFERSIYNCSGTFSGIGRNLPARGSQSNGFNSQ